MALRVDRERCMGSGSCQFHAPHTFDLDAECRAIVIDEQGDPLQAIRNAAEGCPTRAIAVEGGPVPPTPGQSKRHPPGPEDPP